jgi:hypothetical protein
MENNNTPQKLKTRYMVIRIDITEPNASFSDNTTTKFIYAYSGSPLTDSPANTGMAYAKVDVLIQQSIGFTGTTGLISICGMDISDINTLTRSNLSLGIDFETAPLVTVYAGYSLNSDGLPPLAYSGFIIFAGPDYNNSRDRPFIIRSLQYFNQQNTNTTPSNSKGVISLDNLFKFICNQSGYIYKSYNITGNTYNSVLIGSSDSQLKQLAQQFALNITFDYSVLGQTIVYVAPKGEPYERTDYVLSANNDMIGFPVVENFGFSVRTYYNPAIIIGQSLTVNSESVPYINNKDLYINEMVHKLHNRDEPWQSELQLNLWLGLRGN